MSINDIVKVTITRETASVSRAGFGTPCVLAFLSTTHFTERAKVYDSLDGLEADGFGEEHFVHRAVKSIVSQNPKVERIVIGRRALGVARRVVLTPTGSPPALTAFKVTVNDQVASYTTDATPTVAEVTAGLAAAIAALMPVAWAATTAYVVGDRRKNVGNIYVCVVGGTSGSTGPSGTRDDIVDGTVTWAYVGPTVTATDTGPGTSVTVLQDTAGAPFVLEVERRDLLSQEDTTVDPGIATDLSAVRTSQNGNDDWYMLVTDSHGAAETAALASAIETLTKQYLAASADSAVPTSATSDIASTLAAASYTRSPLLWHEKTASFPDAAWAGRCLPLDPGSETWKFKTLAGITPTFLTASELGFLDGKAANHYTTVGGVNITAEGVNSTGDFIDLVRLVDALQARIQENVYSLLVNVDKVPFTAAGIAQVETQIREALLWAEGTGGLVDTFVTPPTISDISPADRAARIMRPFKFGGRLTGAVHSLELEGTLTI